MPVLSVMNSRTKDEIMINATSQQVFVQVLINSKKEVTFSAINNQRQITGLYLVELVNHCMLIP